ncbi:hypothetical protein FRC10_010740 [Ceratobasidium sp. 414]|nr:hypothetical protein FRC10_010740 [Ceratobasidium sp. 414]
MSGHRYNAVLKRLTNTGFPATVSDRYRELLLTQRKYAFATLLKRSGALFQPSAGAVAPKSLAIYCSSCPHVGVNFRPEDVTPDERPYFRFYMVFDGNFRNPRKAKKVDKDDVCLTTGRMYYVEQAPYKAWITSKKQEVSEVCCFMSLQAGVPALTATITRRRQISLHDGAAWMSLELARAHVPGIVYSFHLVWWTSTKEKGKCHINLSRSTVTNILTNIHLAALERFWVNVDYAIASAASAILVWGLTLLGLTYDIFCHWFPNFKDRVKALPPNLVFDMLATGLLGGIPRFHAAGHIESCRVRWSLNYLPYFGRIEGEGCECAWAYLNETAGSTSEKSPGARWDTINYIVADWNFEKNIMMTSFIVGKFNEAKRMYEQQLSVFTDLDKSLPLSTTVEWRQESTAPCKEGKVWTSPFFGKNNWDKSMHEVLQEEEDREVVDQWEEGDHLAANRLEEGNGDGTQPRHIKACDDLVKWLTKAIELENTM